MLNNWIDETWEKIDKKLSKVAVKSQNKIPYTTCQGEHNDMQVERNSEGITWWTNGFWPGMMWLMYQGTQNETYKQTAEHAEVLLDKALEKYDGLHHDVGFMWHISSGVNYRLTGNEHSKVRALYAANLLAGRYNLNGKFIRAWNGECTGWAIIDCMMNIPLLYWASRETNDPRFRYIAESHADTTMASHVRADGSVKHIVVHDHINGGVLEEKGGQGYEEGSSWSRGQAWGYMDLH